MAKRAGNRSASGGGGRGRRRGLMSRVVILETLESRMLLTGFGGFATPSQTVTPSVSESAPAASVNKGVVEIFTAAAISGYAFSSFNDAAPVHVIVTVDGVAHDIVADGERPELVATLGSANHGFS